MNWSNIYFIVYAEHSALIMFGIFVWYLQCSFSCTVFVLVFFCFPLFKTPVWPLGGAIHSVFLASATRCKLCRSVWAVVVPLLLWQSLQYFVCCCQQKSFSLLEECRWYLLCGFPVLGCWSGCTEGRLRSHKQGQHHLMKTQ